MNSRQIYDMIMKHDPEWIREFIRLVKLCREAAPEHRMIVLDMLRNGGRSHDAQ